MIDNKPKKFTESASKYVSARTYKSSSSIRSSTNLTGKMKYLNMQNIGTIDILANSLIKFPRLQGKNLGYKRFKVIRKKNQARGCDRKNTEDEALSRFRVWDEKKRIKGDKLKIDPSLKTVKSLGVIRHRSSDQISDYGKMSPLGRGRGCSVERSLNDFFYFCPHSCFPPAKQTRLKPVSISPSTGLSIFTIN